MSRAQTIVQAAIALIVCFGFVFVMLWAIIVGFPPASDGGQALYILLGILSTAFGAILPYYFQAGGKKE